LSDRLKVSRRRLERHFGEALHLSPAEAGISVRLNFARHLLESTDHSITRIASASGFCDASHFSKVFRGREGETPLSYRQRTLRAIPA
jgi:transcriptional regulator GlxA family with amidase domain